MKHNLKYKVDHTHEDDEIITVYALCPDCNFIMNMSCKIAYEYNEEFIQIMKDRLESEFEDRECKKGEKHENT